MNLNLLIASAAVATAAAGAFTMLTVTRPLPAPAVSREHKADQDVRIVPLPVKAVRIEAPPAAPITVTPPPAAPMTVTSPAPKVASADPEPVIQHWHQPVMDVCRRHGGYKVVTHGGRSWRCRFR